MKYLKLYEGYFKRALQNAVDGYLYCAIWTNELEQKYDTSDFSEESYEKATQDVEKFLELAGDLISKIDFDTEFDYSSIGHDFWLTRNGHGAGFWDRKNLEKDDIGNKLTEICKENFNEVWCYVGDDDKLYIE